MFITVTVQSMVQDDDLGAGGGGYMDARRMGLKKVKGSA
jgi:hypothetical protein